MQHWQSRQDTDSPSVRVSQRQRGCSAARCVSLFGRNSDRVWPPRQRNRGGSQQAEQKERQDVYRLTDFSYLTNKTYHRLACQKTVNFFVATNSKLVVHERGSRHVEGLARLRKEKQDAEERAIPLQDLSDGQLPQQPGASEAKQQVVVEAESADGCPCHGLGLEEGSPLHSLRAGITTFFQRMPLSEARPTPWSTSSSASGSACAEEVFLLTFVRLCL